MKHCLEFSAARKVPFDLMSEMSETRSRASFGRYIALDNFEIFLMDEIFHPG